MKNSVSPDRLKIFLAVLDAGGFRAAALRLGTVPSRVSTTVARLEADIGVPLLLRSTRSVRATEQGRRLADTIRPLFHEVEEAVSEAANSMGTVRGRLALNVPGAVVPDILPPLIAEFQRLHPEVEIEIVVENDRVDIIAAGCDAGIRYGAHLAKDMVSIPIGPRTQQMAFAASPDYLNAHPKPELPEDLTGHAAIRYRLPGGTLLPWRLRNAAGETVMVEPPRSLVISVNAFDSGLSYARAGMGIIAVFRNWCEADFRAGTLVPLLEKHWPVLDGPRLYYPSRFAGAPLRAFIAVCQRQAG
ncbi:MULTISPECIES: LysR family transcriptional regulator [unclassified Devosia]|uniref:LysR family transcriptional regulator n=1 Tax=unclassified Devosia TaxID=196773 RepID=UPI000712A3AE|nr:MULTISPECIES: LysR family transcriptional regulator [unclassified Devosia]KQN72322.1 LysR family transcriptional regulator [Devosia sp. Leaf64]KQT49835.1 LysR family transcriptional regulator [Devosia sp. Leaf420]